jgi:ABC-type glycerol-3-phosphate transport system permease component
MVINSFKTRFDFIKSAVSLPHPFTIQSYVDAFQGKSFGLWFINSIIITTISTVLSTIISAFAGYAFAKMDFKGKDSLFSMIIPLMSIPPVVLLIPQFRLMVTMGLINTRISVIIIYVGIMLPFTIYLLRNFFISLPDSLVEAALLDGCNNLQVFTRIMIPLSMPAMVTASVVNAVWAWNELLIALVFLQQEGLRTLIVGITLFKSRFTLNVPVIMAGLTIVTIPMLILYVLGQRQLIQGLLAGAIKE